MEEIKGTIKKIIYSNDNGFAIIVLESDTKETIIKGNISTLKVGDDVIVKGRIELHPVYGAQLYVNEFEIVRCDDKKALLRYLSKGAVKGVGSVLASRIVDTFGDKTMEIIENTPDELTKVKGISKRIAKDIYEEIVKNKETRDILIFLSSLGLGTKISAAILKRYGNDAKAIINDNPYALIDDIRGVGFVVADNIAMKLGIYRDSEFRLKAAIIYVLKAASNLSGHIYLPKSELIKEVIRLVEIEETAIKDILVTLVVERKIIVKSVNEEKRIYLKENYYTELEVARRIYDLSKCVAVNEELAVINKNLKELFQKNEYELDEKQKKAVELALVNGVFIISGGPGTGKTTIIKNIITYLEKNGYRYLLAAPTGRAAKRMSEATNREAKTIHRLLEISIGGDFEDDEIEDEKNLMLFGKNEDEPLDTDVVIIDEVSMLDIYLMNSLLKAISGGTRLVLVGDINQLPSVGAGEVLKDLINSNVFNSIYLNTIYRQQEGSNIVINAHKIVNEQEINLDEKSDDFMFIEMSGYENIKRIVAEFLIKKIPSELNINPYDIQVLTPTRKGNIGVVELNRFIQNIINSSSEEKIELMFGDNIFRSGDKVIQIKNNYRIKWSIYNEIGSLIEDGQGIYNGDVGVITDINLYTKTIEVHFDDKVVVYDYKDLGELELAYALTIHKSQGSEYPAIIIPIFSCPYLLLNRNIIYTGITRAKHKVILIGSKQEVLNMIKNKNSRSRYTSLADNLIMFSQLR